MKKIHVKLSAFLMFFVSCARFPYHGLIDKSSKYLLQEHKDKFFTIEIESEKYEYIRFENKTKPLLILIHGSPGSWSSFAHFFKNKRLLDNFEMITFSRLGYGRNKKGIPFKNLDDQIEIPLRLIKKFKNNRKVFVLGHSYGGPVAIKLGMEIPKLVDYLFLLAASVDPELEKMKWYQHVAKLWGIRSLIPDDLDVCNREILGLKKELIKMEKDYNKLHQKAVVFQGDEDNLVPWENINYLKKHYLQSDVRYITLKEGNHFLPWRNEKLITDLLLEYKNLIKD